MGHSGAQKHLEKSGRQRDDVLEDDEVAGANEGGKKGVVLVSEDDSDLYGGGLKDE